jgi:hypothetical protein
MKIDDTSKLVIVVGAGSTYSDAVTLPIEKRPPLDKFFFKNITDQKDRERVDKINQYMQENYGLNILDEENDAIENVMRFIYSDLFNLSLEEKAEEAFHEMLFLYNKRIAETTNNLGPPDRLNLYRILDFYLTQGYHPQNITFITYNHDLQIEKILEHLGKTSEYQHLEELDVFPSYYRINIGKDALTKPKASKKHVKLFNVNFKDGKTIQLLKLHGSLNWYSLHKDRIVNPKKMANTDREIHVTQRQEIDLTMKVSGQLGRGARFTLPIVVPPVIHKSEIFHEEIKALWKYAEDTLQDAHEILIFGYSCSPLDFESSNLFKRALRKNNNWKNFTVIDPSSDVLKRYVDLVKPNKVNYFPNAQQFFENM